MSAAWILLDAVLEQLDRDVVAHPPERGGVLLGPAGYPVVSHFVLDDDAHTTSVVYVPSVHISERIAAAEAPGTLELKGVIHSHPGLDRLSRQDESTFGELLNLNPHLPRCLAPVATQLTASAEHEVATPSGKLSCYEIRRTRDGFVIQCADWAVMPVLSVARGVGRATGAESVSVIGPSTSFGPLTVDVLLGDDVVLAFPLGFPLVPPAVLSAGRLLPFRWSATQSAVSQIATAVLTGGRTRRPRTRRRIGRVHC